MRKKLILTIVLAVLLIGMVVCIAVYVNATPKETKWNICIWVENKLQSDIILHMERSDENGGAPELMTDISFEMERWMPIGWLPYRMNDKARFERTTWIVEETYSDSWEINLNMYYKKLPMGLYRISKRVVINGDYNASGEIGTYYAPFVIASWWEILLTILCASALLWLLWKRGRNIKFTHQQ